MKADFSKITAVTAGKTKTSGISPFSELEISKVYPNPDQPRKQFDDIEELASTIKEHGLLQPITVVKKDDGYMIVSGERRYKAHLFNEAKTIKAYILDATDEEVQELTLIENIQRNDLTDFEIANHIVGLWKTGRYEKKSDLAKRVGKSESYVSKAFSSLNLDDEILEDITVNKKDISISVMDEISRVKDKKVQKEVYQKYNAGEITRDNIKEFKEPKSEKEEINIALKKYEDTEKDLVDQAKNFTHNFPTGNLEATFKVSDLVKNTDKNLQIVGDKIVLFGKSDKHRKSLYIGDFAEFYFFNYVGEHKLLESDSSYRLIIEKMGKGEYTDDAKEVVSNIKRCMCNYTIRKGKNVIGGKMHGTVLDNDYEIAIFDLLKENLELKKELHNLKENQTVQDNSILENDIKKLLTKKISIININKISNIFKTDDGKSIILDIEQSIKYFRNCKQKEFRISFIFESARKIFIDEVLGKLDDYVLNEDEKILFNNKTEIIKIIEVCESNIYVEYDNFDAETISYSKAKELIKKSTQRSIPYTISAKTEKAYDFINKMPNRTQENSNLILKGK